MQDGKGYTMLNAATWLSVSSSRIQAATSLLQPICKIIADYAIWAHQLEITPETLAPVLVSADGLVCELDKDLDERKIGPSIGDIPMFGMHQWRIETSGFGLVCHLELSYSQREAHNHELTDLMNHRHDGKMSIMYDIDFDNQRHRLTFDETAPTPWMYFCSTCKLVDCRIVFVLRYKGRIELKDVLHSL